MMVNNYSFGIVIFKTMLIKMTVYDHKSTNWSIIIFWAPNFFMHLSDVLIFCRQSIKLMHQAVVGVDGPLYAPS